MYSMIKKMGLGLEISKPASEKKIGQCERKLNVTFGLEYRTFLKEFGCLSIEYLEFYGLCGSNNSAPSTLHVTLKMREQIDNFPSDLVVVYENGNGSFQCVDSNDNIYFCEYNQCYKINKTFREFILQKIKGL